MDNAPIVNPWIKCNCGNYDSAHKRDCPRYGHDIHAENPPRCLRCAAPLTGDPHVCPVHFNPVTSLNVYSICGRKKIQTGEPSEIASLGMVTADVAKVTCPHCRSVIRDISKDYQAYRRTVKKNGGGGY